MSDYLIALSIGPVQGFIAAARKTRDLWFGSYVLSEISKAAARSFAEFPHGEVALIFPAPDNLTQDLAENSALNVANKLLVQLSDVDEDAVKTCLEHAKKATQARWEALALTVKNEPRLRNQLHTEMWNEQVKDVLELFGAWVQISAYQSARERVDTLLAARKMTRDFLPAAPAFNEKPYFGLPKSSLDAARETVLQQGINKRARRKLGLGQNEQLDCPGVVKRLGGDTEQFPPVTRIALETWLAQIPQDMLESMRKPYKTLLEEDLATPVKRQGYEKFPFDGGLLFPDRIAAERQALDADEVAALEALKQLETLRQTLYKTYGEPESYYAILVADGDKMGAYLDSCQELKQHQAVSRALDKFARNAPALVKEHQGACVYSGGDDVMALLPIHRAVQCAAALRDDFNEKVKDLPEYKDTKRPTLSVGLGLAHVMTPFSVALEVGRNAETLAKAKDLPISEQGNALAMIADVRSGARLQVRGQWATGIVASLAAWQTAYQTDKLPATTPYELQQAAQRMAWTTDQAIILQELVRVLKKKRESGGDKDVAESLIAEIENAIQQQGVEPVLQQLRIARWLAAKH